jgi:hypothetical protein
LFYDDQNLIQEKS